MITKKELEKIISKYNDEEQKKFMEWISPFYDFCDFMLDNHNKTFEDIEKESEKLSENVISDYMKELKTLDLEKDSQLEFITKIPGKIYKKYAESYKYDKSIELEHALNIYMDIFLKNELLNGNKQ